jgi:hypothetical protein
LCTLHCSPHRLRALEPKKGQSTLVWRTSKPSRCYPSRLASPGSQVPHWAVTPCLRPKCVDGHWPFHTRCSGPLSRFFHALSHRALHPRLPFAPGSASCRGCCTPSRAPSPCQAQSKDLESSVNLRISALEHPFTARPLSVIAHYTSFMLHLPRSMGYHRRALISDRFII